MKLSNKKIMIILGVVLLILILPMFLAVNIYESNFGRRFETVSWIERDLDEFEGLDRIRHTFTSNDGQKLIGYTYTKSLEPKGVIVIAHGLGGGGHNSYMDIADYFTDHNYLVFAYDATGNDESEGESINGFPQGLIDLDYALRYIKEDTSFDGLPILLLGQSWGGYSVGSVLNIHPDVSSAVMMSACNQSSDIILEEGERIMGSGMVALMPYINLLEKVKFGDYSDLSCVDGLNNTDADILIVHSIDDELISYSNQYEMFKEQFEADDRFKFISFEDRGHSYIYYSDSAKEYRRALNEGYAAFIKDVEDDQRSEMKTAYMNEHLDKSKLFDLDQVLFKEILEFYNQSIK